MNSYWERSSYKDGVRGEMKVDVERGENVKHRENAVTCRTQSQRGTQMPRRSLPQLMVLTSARRALQTLIL